MKNKEFRWYLWAFMQAADLPLTSLDNKKKCKKQVNKNNSSYNCSFEVDNLVND